MLRPDAKKAALLGLLLAARVFAQSPPASNVASIEPLIQFKATADPKSRRIAVDVAWPSGLKPRFPRDESGVIQSKAIAPVGTPKLPAVLIEDQPGWADTCLKDGCRLMYEVDVAKGIANDRRGDLGFEEKQGIIMAPLIRWLVRPEDRRVKGRLHLDFEGGKHFELVSGAMDGRLNHVDTDIVVMDGPHVVLGDFVHRSVDIQGGHIDIAIGEGKRAVSDDEIVQWIREGAIDIASMLGHFPVARLQVIVGRGGPYSIGTAVTMGMGGASIFVVVGEKTRRSDLARDWVMTHEMMHVAFPNMGPRQRWMEEGLSTYLEPLLRARRGRFDVAQLWAEFVRAMPQGLPKEDDQGLDRTFTWGRRYWGGALFWFYVDVDIRKKTEGARSLDDVMRGVLASGGTVAVRWDVDRLAKVAENATGTNSLREIYDEWSMKPVAPDLAAMWAALGVKAAKNEKILVDDTAPDANVRRELTQKPAVADVATRP